MKNTGQPTIRIFRAGNGKATAQLSPQPLHAGESFSIRNFTDCAAEVDFGGAPIKPPKSTVPARSGEPGEKSFKVDDKAPYDYYEYDITLLCTRGESAVTHYVEGGSKPSVIIDG